MKIRIALIFTWAATILAQDITVSKFKFTGYRNVWNDGTDHQHLDIGDIDVDGEDTIIQVCANRCAISSNECDAFYIKAEADGTECHLVNENSGVNRTIGYGQDMQVVYYVKTQVGGSLTVPRPDALEPPCDQDYNTLSATDCSAFSPDVITYRNCTAVQNTYIGTVGILSDTKCEGEDRILQCELLGKVATSNINNDTSKALLDLAFQKSYVNQNPFRSNAGDMVKYIEMTFAGGPREVKRIIVRSATDTTVDKLKEGKFTFFKGATKAEISFLMATEQVCAVHINLSGATTAVTAVSSATDKLRLDVISVFNGVKLRTGFKLDIFVKEIKLTLPAGY